MSDKKISELAIAPDIQPSDISVLVRDDVDYKYTFALLVAYVAANVPVGANISFGSIMPQNISGKNGDVFFNSATISFAQKISGAWTVVYTFPSFSGITDGTVLYGIGIPGPGIGNNNDTYINTASGIFYKKSADNWNQVFSMQTGPQGTQGLAGTNGINGTNGYSILNGITNPSNTSTGVNGDFYINTNNYTLFGPKTDDIWGVGVSLTGDTGPKGDKGDIGPAGANGVKGDKGEKGDTGPAGPNDVTGTGVTANPYGPISVTMPTDGDYSYYGLARNLEIGWGIGIDDVNNMVFGTGSSRDTGGKFTSILASLSTLGEITIPENFIGNKFIKNGGLATEFLMADGSVSTVLAPDGILNGLALSVSESTVIVTPGTWRINNVVYGTSANTSLTLNAADEVSNRIDLVYANINNEILVLEGTATANPVKPSLPADCVEIGFALITPTGNSTTSAPPANYVTVSTFNDVVGNKTELVTNDKNNLVEAINEIKQDVSALNQDNVILKIFKKSNYS